MSAAALKVVLDANVLYPALLRSLLIDLAVLGVYKAHWTGQIQEEWQRNLLLNRPDLQAAKLKKVEGLMNAALPDALVTGYEALAQGVSLPDPDDAHVVAAARHVGANGIVTANLRDFPAEGLAPYGLRALSADQFLLTLLAQNPSAVREAVQIQQSRYRNPPLTLEDLLAQLAKQGAARFAQEIADL